MVSFGKIANKAKTYLRYGAFALGITASWGYAGHWALKQVNGSSHPVEYQKQSSEFNPHLDKGWETWKKTFTAELNGSLFVIDPSQGNQIVSEGLAFGKLLAVQQGDRKTFDAISAGLSQLEGRGLPAWRAYIEKGKLVIKSDADHASAADADQDNAFADVQAHFLWGGGGKTSPYLIRAQMYLDRIWDGEVGSNGTHRIFLPSANWGGSSSGYGMTHNPSYPSLFMYEVFASVDTNAKHDWNKLMIDSSELRRTIIETDHIGKLAKKPLIEIPDWVVVSWPDRKPIELFPHPTRQATMGFDAIRTLWRIALDASLLKNETIRNDTIRLARKMMDADIQNKAVTSIKDKEIALAAFTALAYAATLPISGEKAPAQYLQIYNELKIKLKGIAQTDGTFSNGTDKDIRERYYDQTSAWIGARILDGGFQGFTVPIFTDSPSAPGKEGQALRYRHRGLMVSTEYLPVIGGQGSFIGPKARAELDLTKRLVWLYDESGKLRPQWTESLDNGTNVVRLKTAGELTAQRFFFEAGNQYRHVLETASPHDDKEMCANAVLGLLVSMKESSTPAEAAVSVFEEINRAKPHNFYVELGLAIAKFNTYSKDRTEEARIAASGLSTVDDPFISYSAFSLSAQIHRNKADKDVQTGKDPIPQLKLAQAAIDKAISGLEATTVNLDLGTVLDLEAKKRYSLRTAFDPDPNETRTTALMDLYLTKADIHSRLHEANKATDKTNLQAAADAFEKVRAGSDKWSKQHFNASVGLAALYRESKEYKKAEEIINDDLASLALKYKKTPAHIFLDANYYKLRTEKARSLRDQKLTPKAHVEAVDIAGHFPSGRIRHFFDRIAYFIGRGEYVKAQKDARLLTDFRSSLSNPRHEQADQTAQVARLVIHVRTVLLPKLSSLSESKVGEREKLENEFRTAYIDTLKDKTLRDRLLGYAKGREFESIAEDAERVLELGALSAAYPKGDGLIDARSEILEYAGSIELNLSAGARIQSQVIEAGKIAAAAAETCDKGQLKEVSFSTESAEAALDFFEEVIWTTIETDKPFALSFAKELLGEEYVGDTKLDVEKSAVKALRDPEIRGAISNLLGSNPARKQSLYEKLGDMYSISDSAKAVEYFRQSLGLAAEQNDPIAERDEFERLLNERPETAPTITKIKKLRHFDMLSYLEDLKTQGKITDVRESALAYLVKEAGTYTEPVGDSQRTDYTSAVRVAEKYQAEVKADPKGKLRVAATHSFVRYAQYLIESRQFEFARKLLAALEGTKPAASTKKAQPTAPAQPAAAAAPATPTEIGVAASSYLAGWKSLLIEMYTRTYKNLYRATAGDGSILVKDPSQQDKIVSESNAYWLRITAQMAKAKMVSAADTQSEFDGLLKGVDHMIRLGKTKSGGGLPAWKVIINNGIVELAPNIEISKGVFENPQNSASDADLDIVFALITADELVQAGIWKAPQIAYSARVKELLPSIKNLFREENGVLVLSPSEDWDSFIFTDYISPETYLAIESFCSKNGMTDEARFFGKAARDGVSAIKAIIAATGQFPAQAKLTVEQDGSITVAPNVVATYRQTWDGVRGPLRFGAYLLSGGVRTPEEIALGRQILTHQIRGTNEAIDSTTYMAIAVALGDRAALHALEARAQGACSTDHCAGSDKYYENTVAALALLAAFSSEVGKVTVRPDAAGSASARSASYPTLTQDQVLAAAYNIAGDAKYVLGALREMNLKFMPLEFEDLRGQIYLGLAGQAKQEAEDTGNSSKAIEAIALYKRAVDEYFGPAAKAAKTETDRYDFRPNSEIGILEANYKIEMINASKDKDKISAAINGLRTKMNTVIARVQSMGLSKEQEIQTKKRLLELLRSGYENSLDPSDLRRADKIFSALKDGGSLESEDFLPAFLKITIPKPAVSGVK